MKQFKVVPKQQPVICYLYQDKDKLRKVSREEWAYEVDDVEIRIISQIHPIVGHYFIQRDVGDPRIFVMIHGMKLTAEYDLV